MRKFFTLLWLLCPVAAVYYHFNECQNELLRVQARQKVEGIRAMERQPEPDWPAIMEAYDELSAMLPKDEAPLVQHQIRLARTKAQLETLDVAGSIEELTHLLQESAQTHGETATITRAVRETLGKARDAVGDRLGEAASQAKDMASAAADEVSRGTAHGPG